MMRALNRAVALLCALLIAGPALAAIVTPPTTDASKLTTGTLPSARLPTPTASTLGGVESIAPVTHQVVGSINTSGVPALVTLSSADLSDGASLLTTTAAASTYAPLVSPALTGTPTAPTAAAGTNTTQLATTAFTNSIFASPPALGSVTPAAVTGTTVTATGKLSTAAGQVIGWSTDACFSRTGASQFAFGNCTQGDVSGILHGAQFTGNAINVTNFNDNSAAFTHFSLGAANANTTFNGGIIAAGTAPTLTGTCTTGSKVGGATAGSFTATCSTQIVIVALPTAPNGWVCTMHDQTSGTDPLHQTAQSASSCTVTGTTGAADVVVWEARGY